MASRYDLFRRVGALAALALAVTLLFREGCGAEERAAVDFTVELGAAAGPVERVRVELWDGSALIGAFEAAADRPLRWRHPVPREELTAKITVTRPDGTTERIERRIHAPEGASVAIPFP